MLIPVNSSSNYVGESKGVYRITFDGEDSGTVVSVEDVKEDVEDAVKEIVEDEFKFTKEKYTEMCNSIQSIHSLLSQGTTEEIKDEDEDIDGSTKMANAVYAKLQVKLMEDAVEKLVNEYPDYLKYKDMMIAMSNAHPNKSPKEVYLEAKEYTAYLDMKKKTVTTRVIPNSGNKPSINIDSKPATLRGTIEDIMKKLSM